MMLDNAPVIIPIIYLTATLLIALSGTRFKHFAYPLALLALFFSSFVALINLYTVIDNGTIRYFFGGWLPPVGIEYILDPLSAFVILVINFVAFIVIIHSRKVNEIELESKQVPYYAVVMLLLLGFNGIVLTGDFFNLFVFLEISSLSGYALIAVGERGSAFAAFKYLLLGTIGASFYLLGLGFLYMITGSLNMTDLHNIIPFLSNEPVLIIALVLMVIGTSIKMAIFPLHGWLPDSYTLAPSASSALIAPIGTKVASYVLIRILLFVFGEDFVSVELPILDILGWLAAAGIIYGSIMAIAQNELKRMLAYSSIAQIGYIALGISMASPLGFIGAVLHILNHAFMKACLFLVAGNLRTKVGHSDISKFDNTYRNSMPWTMAAFTIAAISMIGLPPMAGFFSKWYLVLATIENSEWIFLAVILISSLLNAVYFFRIIEKVYLTSTTDEKNEEEKVKFGSGEPVASMLIPVLIFAVGLILLGIFNALIVNEVIQLMIPSGL